MLTINLFDHNFSHSPFSTAFQSTDQIEWIRGLMKFDGITVFTDAYIHNPIVDEVKTDIRVGWLHETQCQHPVTYYLASQPHIYEKFDYILTYYEPLLRHPSGKFRKVIYGGVWLPELEWGLRPKTKCISMLYGAKMATRGHQIRHEIAHALGDRYGIDYYGFRGTPVNYSPQTKLTVLKDYQFSIVCETCREDNLFTEILLDCFAVGTIPLFWGCPNISDYFDGLGILSFRSVQELESLIRELDEHTYDYLLTFARENLRRLPPFRITEEWMVSNGVFGEVLA